MVVLQDKIVSGENLPLLKPEDDMASHSKDVITVNLPSVHTQFKIETLEEL